MADGLRADSPPWHDVQLQLRGPAVGVLDTVFRERWDDPNSPDADHPIAWIARQAAPHPDARRPAAAAAAAAAGVRAAPRADACAPTRRSGRRTTSPRDGRAVGGPRLHEGDQAGPPAGLPGGPVHVVRRGRPAVRRGAARAPGAAPGGRGAAGARPGRRVRRAPAVRRPVAGDRDVPAGRARTGCTCSTWRTTRGRRSTCTRRSAWSTTSGPASAATTSTAGPGRTTASSPAPSWTPPATPASRATRPGTGDGARTFARDLRLTLAREHLDLRRRRQPRTTTCSTRSASSPTLDRARRGPGGLARRRPAWAPGRPGRLRPHRTEQLPLLTRLWATPLYRLVDDPDGRPLRLRRKKEF